MSIQEEIHQAMQEIQQKINQNKTLSEHDMELLLLTSLIEEEGQS